MEFRHFDLNLLRALDALLEKRNVTNAAESMFVTQQAMSASLSRLRKHFELATPTMPDHPFDTAALTAATLPSSPRSKYLSWVHNILWVKRPLYKPHLVDCRI